MPRGLTLLILYLLPSLIVRAAADVSFSAPKNTPVGNYPHRIAVGDVNNDGQVDALVLNRDSHSVTVLLGNGDGSFQTANIYDIPVGISYPTDIAVGDFNKDGNLDMAVSVGRVGFDGNTVYVFLGNGDGSFQPSTSVNPGVDSPLSLAVADLDEDGNLDLIVGTGQMLGLLFGNGDGTFKPPVEHQYTNGIGIAIRLAVGDFNNDGHPDIAIAAMFDLAIVLNNGDGTFGPASFAPCADPNTRNEHCTAIVTGDFNADGNLDVAITEYESYELRMYLGNGDGTLQAPVIYAAGRSPGLLAAADFNLDGNLDLAIAASGDNAVTLLAGDGSGSFSAWYLIPVQTAPVAIAVADFNNDSLPDLIVANSGSNTVSVLLNSTNTSGSGNWTVIQGHR